MRRSPSINCLPGATGWPGEPAFGAATFLSPPACPICGDKNLAVPEARVPVRGLGTVETLDAPAMGGASEPECRETIFLSSFRGEEQGEGGCRREMRHGEDALLWGHRSPSPSFPAQGNFCGAAIFLSPPASPDSGGRNLAVPRCIFQDQFRMAPAALPGGFGLEGVSKTGLGDIHNILTRRSCNRSSAELHSAVARIWNPQDLGNSRVLQTGSPLAEYNSALQQIENLRYEGQGQSFRRARILTNSSSTEGGPEITESVSVTPETIREVSPAPTEPSAARPVIPALMPPVLVGAQRLGLRWPSVAMGKTSGSAKRRPSIQPVAPLLDAGVSPLTPFAQQASHPVAPGLKLVLFQGMATSPRRVLHSPFPILHSSVL